MIEIVKQTIEEHTGETYRFEYQTQHYFHPTVTQSVYGFSVSFERCAFASKESRGFESALNQPFLENPSLFFAYDEQKRHIGLIELSRESWNNRLRVSNLLVFPSDRHQGVGTMLMNTAKHIARTEGFRGIVLETQSCNENAIAFYLKNGFSFIGCDLCAYSDEDIKKHEVRIELFWKTNSCEPLCV